MGTPKMDFCDPRLEEILSQPGSPERPRSNRIQGVLAWIVESTVFECVTGGRRWDSRFGIRSTPIIADHHHYIYILYNVLEVFTEFHEETLGSFAILN